MNACITKQNNRINILVIVEVVVKEYTEISESVSDVKWEGSKEEIQFLVEFGPVIMIFFFFFFWV